MGGAGVYSQRITTSVPSIWDQIKLGQLVSLEGLPVRITSISSRPIDPDEMDDWPDASPDDRIVTVAFTDVSEPRW